MRIYFDPSIVKLNSQRIAPRPGNIRRPGHELDPLQVFEPYPGIFACYDGRPGDRYHSEDPNWLDGASTLGVCTYSIVRGAEAQLFDAELTTNIAAFMLNHVTNLGLTKTTMVYNFFHNNYIAGASALKDTTMIEQLITVSTTKIE